MLLQGQLPSAVEALQLYRALNNAGLGLRVPMQLETQLLQVQAIDSDVGQSMFHLLQVDAFLSIANLPASASAAEVVSLAWKHVRVRPTCALAMDCSLSCVAWICVAAKLSCTSVEGFYMLSQH